MIFKPNWYYSFKGKILMEILLLRDMSLSSPWKVRKRIFLIKCKRNWKILASTLRKIYINMLMISLLSTVKIKSKSFSLLKWKQVFNYHYLIPWAIMGKHRWPVPKLELKLLRGEHNLLQPTKLIKTLTYYHANQLMWHIIIRKVFFKKTMKFNSLMLYNFPWEWVRWFFHATD